MASVFTQNLGLEEPALGDYVNSWNVPNNANFTLLDQVVGSSTSVALSNADVTLTIAQAAYHTIVLTGALTADIQLILPGAIGGRRYIWNQCSGSNAVTVWNGVTDTGPGVVVPQGLLVPVILTAGRAYQDSYGAVPPGVIHSYVSFPAPPGFLLCYGQAVSTSTYDLLFAAIGYTYGGGGGTFVIPDTRGRILAGADDMGGSAAGRLSGYSFGVTGGQQMHQLGVGEIPSHSHVDAGHGHGVTDPQHTHTFTQVAGAGVIAGGGTSFGTQTATTSASSTGISIQAGNANIQNTGGGGSHNNIQPTMAVNHIIRF